VLRDGYLSGQRGIATIYGEYRGIAWAFRKPVHAHAATPKTPSGGLLAGDMPSGGLLETLLDNQLAYYKQYMLDPNNRLSAGQWR